MNWQRQMQYFQPSLICPQFLNLAEVIKIIPSISFFEGPFN